MHKAEISREIPIDIAGAKADDQLTEHDVVLVRLPNQSFARSRPLRKEEARLTWLPNLAGYLELLVQGLPDNAILALYGAVETLVYAHSLLPDSLRYHHWIVVRKNLSLTEDSRLMSEHFGLTIYQKSKQVLHHAKVRIAYAYCPECDRTTKDYGGRKHLYHEYGTLMSDVWTDFTVPENGPLLDEGVLRFRDMMSGSNRESMLVVDVRNHRLLEGFGPIRSLDRAFPEVPHVEHLRTNPTDVKKSKLINSDALETLEGIPDCSTDLVFADPPYNLSKKYAGYDDNREIQEYYEWCDVWFAHLSRILKPGGVLAAMNIPFRSIRHFLTLNQILRFQSWVVWDSMSLPVRRIMPSHYPILLFSKGVQSSAFNYRRLREVSNTIQLDSNEDQYIYPLADRYCLRKSCFRRRRKKGLNPKKELSDLWTGLSRVKHNTRRWDHPTQLPHKLMARLILLFSHPNSMVLDPFNGVGTTTLSAELLGRRYFGVEISKKYHKIALFRHEMISNGLDPFGKKKGIPLEKNNGVPRAGLTRYRVPKRTIQLAIKTLASSLGHIPTREEALVQLEYPEEFYDNYFKSWSEVTAAARTTGMSEYRASPLQERTHQSKITEYASEED